ncbi:hypothetical protein OF83DRAFT_1082715 [Amylostereum chailletii]|nr:hypothetical protein OF83DRAFT_1082715 [Amylostereum chailletii]
MSHSTSDTHAWTEYGAPFDDDDADVVLRSSDGVHFRVYRVILSKASPLFKDVFAPAAAPPLKYDDPNFEITYDGLPLIAFSETKNTLSLILTLCYPLPSPPAPALDDIILVLTAGQKYELARVSEWAAELFAASPDARKHPAKTLALVCTHHLEREARVAARLCLSSPMTLDGLAGQLPFMDGLMLQRLWEYHRQCAEVAASLARPRNFMTWVKRRNDEVWAWTGSCGCAGSSYTFGPNREVWRCKQWWLNYMERAAEALRVTPTGETVGSEVLLCASYDGPHCSACQPSRIRQSLVEFSQIFAAEVDRRTLQVKLVLPF